MEPAVTAAGALSVSICIFIISRGILNATEEQIIWKPIRCYFYVNIFEIKTVLSSTLSSKWKRNRITQYYVNCRTPSLQIKDGHHFDKILTIWVLLVRTLFF